jgi:lysozyme
MIETERLLKRIKQKEGFRRFPYHCPAGKLSIGYGRNLEANGISKDEAQLLLENDVWGAFEGVWNRLKWAKHLDGVRLAMLTEMAFNMGLGRLLTFKKMLTAMARGDYKDAASEALDSKWATQVGKRAEEIAQMIETGEWI